MRCETGACRCVMGALRRRAVARHALVVLGRDVGPAHGGGPCSQTSMRSRNCAAFTVTELWTPLSLSMTKIAITIIAVIGRPAANPTGEMTARTTPRSGLTALCLRRTTCGR